jgi:hypothetical protein
VRETLLETSRPLSWFAGSGKGSVREFVSTDIASRILKAGLGFGLVTPQFRFIEVGFMKSFTKVMCLSVLSLSFSLALAGCGGPDNEKTSMTNADGTPTKIEGAPSGPTSADQYNSASKVGGSAPGYGPKKK